VIDDNIQMQNAVPLKYQEDDIIIQVYHHNKYFLFVIMHRNPFVWVQFIHNQQKYNIPSLDDGYQKDAVDPFSPQF